jgi:hypothetical protein
MQQGREGNGEITCSRRWPASWEWALRAFLWSRKLQLLHCASKRPAEAGPKALPCLQKNAWTYTLRAMLLDTHRFFCLPLKHARRQQVGSWLPVGCRCAARLTPTCQCADEQLPRWTAQAIQRTPGLGSLDVGRVRLDTRRGRRVGGQQHGPGRQKNGYRAGHQHRLSPHSTSSFFDEYKPLDPTSLASCGGLATAGCILDPT